MATLRLPGLIDPHVHLRDPGATHKEDWDTGTAAALAGGFTCVLEMPNTTPPVTDAASLLLKQQAARARARCDYGLYLGAGESNVDDAASLAPQVAGLKCYMDTTFGPLKIDGLAALMAHAARWPADRPLACHAEGRNVATAILVAHLTGRAVHICHVATKEEIELIRAAKNKGLKVTCEVAPHHLFLTADDVKGMGGRGTVRTPLATAADRQALRNNLDIVDCFATDHAPHTLEEKDSEKPPPGFPGLETALPLYLALVREKVLTLEDLVQKCVDNPRRIFNIPAQPETWVEVDPDSEWEARGKDMFTRAKWTPFEGWKMRGRITRVVLRGKTAFHDGKVLAPPGSGLDLIREGIPAQPTEQLQRSTRFTAPMASSPGGSRFHNQHILSISQFTRSDLQDICAVAEQMRTMVELVGTFDLLKGKVLACLFYAPSTRTSSSFIAAIERLGGSAIPISGVQFSSVAKGESLPDTVRTLEAYADVIVLRHSETGAAATAARYVKKPIINAGDGVGEHPTQALLDLFTIREELGRVDGLTVTMLGDLKYGRTVHSLARLLSLYDVKLNYVSPEILKMPPSIVEELKAKGVPQREFNSLDPVLAETDVLYVTRVQKEHFTDMKEYESVQGSYSITSETMLRAKPRMVLMHPLPRVGEISMEVDNDPRAAYFRQMNYGLYVRMALLAMVLGKA
ncbi:MAG: aspartate carbamoyltransferase [Myxococcota bacterium]